MLTLYGISQCDTVKKARANLAERGIAYAFHDYKKMGLPQEALEAWIDQVGWEALLNRRGTTWRKLDEAVRDAVCDADSAKALMLAHASVIKRPVVVRGGRVAGIGLEGVLALV